MVSAAELKGSRGLLPFEESEMRAARRVHGESAAAAAKAAKAQPLSFLLNPSG